MLQTPLADSSQDFVTQPFLIGILWFAAYQPLPVYANSPMMLPQMWCSCNTQKQNSDGHPFSPSTLDAGTTMRMQTSLGA